MTIWLVSNFFRAQVTLLSATTRLSATRQTTLSMSMERVVPMFGGTTRSKHGIKPASNDVGITPEPAINRVGMPAEGALKAPDFGVGVVAERVARVAGF